jgi:hypothetical protein
VQCVHLPKVFDSSHVLAIPGDSIHVGNTVEQLGRRPDHDFGHENLEFDGRRRCVNRRGGGQRRGGGRVTVTEKMGI